MDALKKAEQAKRQAQGLPASDGPALPEATGDWRLEPAEASLPGAVDKSKNEKGGGLSLELPDPLPAVSTDASPSQPAPSPPETKYPDLAAALAIPDSDFLSAREPAQPKPTPVSPVLTAPPGLEKPKSVPKAVAAEKPTASRLDPATSTSPRADSGTTVAAERKAAGNVFAAKEAAPAASSKKLFAIVLGGVTLLATAGIGGYFWWQLQPRGLGAPMLAAPRTQPAAPISTAAAPATVATAAPASAVAVAPATAAPPPSIATNDTSDDSGDEEPRKVKGSGKSSGAIKPRTAATSAEPAVAPDDDRPIRLSRAPLKVSPHLSRGYDALQSGDLSLARTAYNTVLTSDPQNLDAMHGMASIAQREDRPELAESWFKRILVANPKDAVALSSLTELYSKANPAAAESRLKAMVIDFPDNAAPQVALGNLFSQQGRWHEAQQAYFNAYASQPENPDVLYNLAVSLEHIGQTRLARQYYAEALTAATRRPARFSRGLVEGRLSALAP